MNAKLLACTSAGSCAASFMAATMPYLQYLAVLISVIAGIASWRASRKK
jgi:hypothetical protein